MAQRLYPGTYIEVLDGNLTTSISIPDDAVLILDRASTGPVGKLYFVQNSQEASIIYGATSPLIKSMQLAYQAGAPNVALYRIGGRVASIDNIFGLDTRVSSVEASSTADVGISVFIGPEPLNPTVDCLIIFNNGKIVYSNVIGGEVDQARFEIEGFSKVNNEYYVGSYNDPVPFELVAQNVGYRIVETASASPVTLAQYSAGTVSTYGFTVKLNGKVLRSAQYTLAAGEVTIDAATLAGVTGTPEIEISYIKKLTSSELEDSLITYQSGKDLMNATWKEYYEAFDQALIDLQLVNVRSVAVGDLFNVPNIANGDTDADRLEYVHITENEYGERSYEWSTSKALYKKNTSTTTDVTEADISANGQPIVVKTYSEVDFAHRAGMFGFSKTSEGIYPNVAVGVIGPSSFTNRAVTAWVGKAPTYNLENKLVVNGSGLLGHKLMVGSTNNTGGYFATDTGHPDGNPITDSNGAVVDLGKYLSIVVSQIVPTATSSSATSSDAVSGAAAYAGLVAITQPGDSTTNQVISGVTIVTEFVQAKLKELNNAGYVVFVNKAKGNVVLSGNLASRVASDYQYISTSIVINRIAADINEVCDPFIGKGIDGTSKVALHTALHSRFAQRQKQGYFIDYLMQLRQLAPNVLAVAYSITAKDELRQVNNTIKLSRSISDEVLS